jgi:hypothetical protein
MLLYRESILFRVYSSVVSFKKTLCRIQNMLSSSLATVQMTCYTVWTPNYPSILCPDDENFPFGPYPVSRSFELFQLASVRTDMEFISNTQIWEDSCYRLDNVDSCPDALIHKASRAFKIQTPDNGLHGSDARASYMEIACIRFTIQTTYVMVQMHQALI